MTIKPSSHFLLYTLQKPNMPRGLKSRQKPKPRKIQIPVSQTNNNVSKTSFYCNNMLSWMLSKIDLSRPSRSRVESDKFRILFEKTLENLEFNCDASSIEYMYTLHIHPYLLNDESKVLASNIHQRYVSVRDQIMGIWKYEYKSEDDVVRENELIPAMTTLDALTMWIKEGRMCWNCHGWENLLKCSGCKKARYCGVMCQEADWERHGGYCQSRQEKRRMKLGATGVPNPK